MNEPEYEPDFKCATFDKSGITPEIRAKMDADRRRAEENRDKPDSASTGDSANVHIEYYFPKGYNPDDEPWHSIKAFHYSKMRAAPSGGGEKWTYHLVASHSDGTQFDQYGIFRLDQLLFEVTGINAARNAIDAHNATLQPQSDDTRRLAEAAESMLR